jgi:parallel beta-helix repeat protein
MLKHTQKAFKFKEKRIFIKVILISIIIISSLLFINAIMSNKDSKDINKRNFSNYQRINLFLNNLIDHEQIRIENDTALGNLAVSGSGTQEDPYVIENFNITTAPDEFFGIGIVNTTRHLILRNLYVQTVEEFADNIVLFNVTNVLIENSSLSNGMGNGLSTFFSNNITIQKNYIYNNDFTGIFIGDNSNDITIKENVIEHNYNDYNDTNGAGDGLTIFQSHNIRVLNNTITENDFSGVAVGINSTDIIVKDNFIADNLNNGIVFFNNVYNYLVDNNTIYSNENAGIFFIDIYNGTISNNNISYNAIHWSGGITFMENCSNNIIERNYIERNNGLQSYFMNHGMSIFDGSNNNIIRENIIFRQSYNAIYFDDSFNNTVYLNDFLENYRNPTTTQGYSNTPDNYWSNGTHGNYWTDYYGRDDDGDGIGDTAYEVDGGSVGFLTEDPYPLMNPWLYIPPEPETTTTATTATNTTSTSTSSADTTTDGSDTSQEGSNNSTYGFGLVSSLVIMMGMTVLIKKRKKK